MSAMKLRDSSRGDPVGFVVAVAVLRRSGQQLAAQGFTAGEIVFQGIEQDFGRKLPRFEHLPLQDSQAVGRVRTPSRQMECQLYSAPPSVMSRPRSRQDGVSSEKAGSEPKRRWSRSLRRQW